MTFKLQILSSMALHALHSWINGFIDSNRFEKYEYPRSGGKDIENIIDVEHES